MNTIQTLNPLNVITLIKSTITLIYILLDCYNMPIKARRIDG